MIDVTPSKSTVFHTIRKGWCGRRSENLGWQLVMPALPPPFSDLPESYEEITKPIMIELSCIIDYFLINREGQKPGILIGFLDYWIIPYTGRIEKYPLLC